MALGKAVHIARSERIADVDLHVSPDLVILDGLIRGGMAPSSLKPPTNPGSLRDWATKTLDYWERAAGFDPRRQPRDDKQRQGLWYAARALADRWIVVSPSPGWNSGERFQVREADGQQRMYAPDDVQELRDTAQQLALQVRYVRAATTARWWPVPHGLIALRAGDPWLEMCTSEEYCQLLEGKIAALRNHLHEIDRKRVVAAWFHDLKQFERPRASGRLADELSRNPAAEEIMTLIGDEQREARSGPQPSAGDAWGRMRVREDGEQDSHRERDVHANPTLGEVLARWEQWPRRLNPTWTGPAEDVRNGQPWMPRLPRLQHGAGPLELELPYRDPWEVEQLLGGLLTRTRRDGRSSSAAPGAGRILLALAKELDTAVSAARAVTDPQLRAECVASIERMISFTENYLEKIRRDKAE